MNHLSLSSWAVTAERRFVVAKVFGIARRERLVHHL